MVVVAVEGRKNHVLVDFSKSYGYFILVASRPLRKVFKTLSEKNSKKNKIFILSKKFRTFFFSAIFSRKKSRILKISQKLFDIFF